MKGKEQKKHINKRIYVLIGVLICFCALWFLGIRFRVPFGTLLVHTWSSVTVYNDYTKEPMKLNQTEIREFYKLMKNFRITTVGIGTDLNGGLRIKTDRGEFTLFGEFIMYGIFRYKVAEENYMDKVYDLLDTFESDRQ